MTAVIEEIDSYGDNYRTLLQDHPNQLAKQLTIPESMRRLEKGVTSLTTIVTKIPYNTTNRPGLYWEYPSHYDTTTYLYKTIKADRRMN